MSDPTKTDDEANETPEGAPEEAAPRSSLPPRPSLVPRATTSARPSAPASSGSGEGPSRPPIPRAPVISSRPPGTTPRLPTPVAGVTRPLPPTPVMGVARPRLPTPVAGQPRPLPPTPVMGVPRPPLAVPRPPTLPRARPPSARPTALESTPPEEVDEIELLDEVEAVESIEPLALSSVPPASEAPALRPEALAPPRLPTRVTPTSRAEPSPEAASESIPAPTPEPPAEADAEPLAPGLASFFEEPAPGEADALELSGDDATQLVEATVFEMAAPELPSAGAEPARPGAGAEPARPSATDDDVLEMELSDDEGPAASPLDDPASLLDFELGDPAMPASEAPAPAVVTESTAADGFAIELGVEIPSAGEAAPGSIEADDLVLELEVDEPAEPDLGVLEAPAAEARAEGTQEAHMTLEQLEAELFGDTPMVALGAAPTAEQGFADLALADDELDEMFRDLEIADEAPETSVEVEATEEATEEPAHAADVSFEDFEQALAAEVELEAVEDEDEDAELIIDDGDEEVEVELDAPTDRGALLAATVTSRRRAQQQSDALYGLDAHAEAQARVELLSDEAGQDDSYTRAAEHLCVVAETLDGAMGETARARNVAERAYALAPEVPAAVRLLRRMDIAEDLETGAFERVLEELRCELAPLERAALLRLAAELAARVRPENAAEFWDELAREQTLSGALAALSAAATRQDRDALAAAIARWSEHTGGDLAASLAVARARLVEASAGDDALEVIREAVRRDPSDAGAWIAMARIGVASVRADVTTEALQGLARAGAGGALSRASEALGAALRAVVGQTVTSTAIDDGGVSGWLMLRAQEEVGVDTAAQLSAAIAAAGDDAEAWTRRAGRLADDDYGRFHALRSAVEHRDDPARARTSAALLGGTGAVSAALLARAEAPGEDERVALGEATGPLATLLAAAAHELRPGDRRDDAFCEIERAEAARRLGAEGLGEAIEALARVSDHASSSAAVAFAARAVASLEGDPARVVEKLSALARRAGDPRRSAASQILASSLGAAYAVDGSADGLAEAAAALPGDPALAELAALFALRGELDPELGAELLDQVAAAGDDRAHRTAAVRAALRRAAVDPDSAMEAVWRAWMRCPSDASLGTLVLRSPAQPTERVAAVLRAQIDAAHTAGASGVGAAIAGAILLSAVLEQAGRHAEAAQVIARARTLALEDATLLRTEERLWLHAGMFAEVAERAFDQLRAATEDDERIAAYERLAELDRSHRGDVASSVLSFQAILESAPGHVSSQRTLERYFVEQSRGEELLEVYRVMVQHLSDPEDALAYAHVAARVATHLGEAEAGAGGPFLRAAFARDLADRRLLISLDAEARRTGDLGLFAKVQLRAAQFAGNDLERVTSFVRAAEGFLSQGAREDGREAVEHALAIDPNHPVALQHAAIERSAAGDHRAAADACETLGRKLRVAAHAAHFLQRAAELWREDDAPRALSLAREAAERDPDNTQAWTLARELARGLGDARVEMELVAMRADAPPSGERADALTLHLRAAELALTLGDRERARAELRRVTELDPSRIEAMRSLAQLTWDDADWTAAADASIRLAKLTHDNAERAEMLFRLGEIFDLHLPDARRAEAAYRRVIQAAPDEVRAHERLVSLYERQGEAAKEFEVLQALTARTMPGPERIARLLRVAELAETAVNDPDRAEMAYEGARREAPGDVLVLRRYAAFLERGAAGEARKVLLERAGAEARRAVDLAPLDPSGYDALVEVRHLRRDDAGARSIASVALCLGVRSELIDAHGVLSSDAPIGARALAPGAVELLSPPSIPANLRTLLSSAQDLLGASAPFDPGAARAEALGAQPHPLRGLVEEWSHALGVEGVELFVADDVPEVARPLGGGRRGLVVPRNLTPSLGLRFAVARALLIDAVGLGIIARLTPTSFTLHLAALLRQFDPMYRPAGVDAAQLDPVARAMTRTFPRERHAELSTLAFQVIERGSTDASALLVGVWELGNRLALLATEDMASAVSLLSPVDGATPEQLASSTALGRLLRVATSDRFAEARRVAERSTSPVSP